MYIPKLLSLDDLPSSCESRIRKYEERLCAFLLLEKASLKRLFLSFAKDGRPIYSTTTTDDGHKWFKEVQSSPGEERELQIPTLYDHKTRSKIKECGLPMLSLSFFL